MTKVFLKEGDDADLAFSAKEYTADIISVVAEAIIRDLPLSSLSVDERVQRGLDPKRAKKIADNFTPSAFGLPAISLRDSGESIIIDGMHRITAKRMLPASVRGGEDPMIRCETWNGLSLPQESKIFVLRNATRVVSAIPLFLVRVNGEEPRAIEIRDMLSRHGWRVALGQGSGQLNAINTVERCFMANAWATEQTLQAITLSWPSRQTIAVEARLFSGLFRCFLKHQGKINMDRLTGKLSVMHPDLVVSEGVYHTKMTPNLTTAQGVGWRIMQAYNKGQGMNLSDQV